MKPRSNRGQIDLLLELLLLFVQIRTHNLCWEIDISMCICMYVMIQTNLNEQSFFAKVVS